MSDGVIGVSPRPPVAIGSGVDAPHANTIRCGERGWPGGLVKPILIDVAVTCLTKTPQLLGYKSFVRPVVQFNIPGGLIYIARNDSRLRS